MRTSIFGWVRVSAKRKPYVNGRDAYLRDTYGITEKQWDHMFRRQSGLCPICGTKLYRYRERVGRRAAPVEHDHKTGRVRGLVCVTCNRWRVGRNTVETAQRVLDYLTCAFDGRTC